MAGTETVEQTQPVAERQQQDLPSPREAEEYEFEPTIVRGLE
jgi:hypothetical protein